MNTHSADTANAVNFSPILSCSCHFTACFLKFLFKGYYLEKPLSRPEAIQQDVTNILYNTEDLIERLRLCVDQKKHNVH